MIVNGGSRRGASDVAKHINNVEKNERLWLFEARGTMISEALTGELAQQFGTLGRMTLEDHTRMALREMEALAVGTKCTLPLYHMNIDPRADEAASMTPEQWRHSLEAIEKVMGLEGHARFAMMHDKEGRQHMHVVWCRIHPDTGKAWHDGHDYRKHEVAARQLEREFGHQHTQGVHVGREPGSPRPERTPKQWEMMQAAKHGYDLKDFRADVRETKQRADGAAAFMAALKEQGRTVGIGERKRAHHSRLDARTDRPRGTFVIIDERGGVHNLGRTLGIKAAALREYMKTVDLAQLPRVERAREDLPKRAKTPTPVHDKEAAQVEADKRLIDGAAKVAPDVEKRRNEEGVQKREANVKRPRPEPPLSARQGEVRLAYRLTDTVVEFGEALTDRGFVLALVTGEDIARRDRDSIADVVHKGDAWMIQSRGAANLNPQQLESAERSYHAWAMRQESTTDKGALLGFDSYVNFVQRVWDERIELAGGREALAKLAASRPLEETAIPTLPHGAREGDIVAVSRQGYAVVLDARSTGDASPQMKTRLATLDRQQLPTGREAQEAQTVEKRAHLGRLAAVISVLSSPGATQAGLFEASREQRVTFAREGGQFHAVTSRHSVALTDAQGWRALECINAARDEIDAHHARLYPGSDNSRAPDPLGHIASSQLPDLRAARRMAYGLERRGELEQTVRDGFDKTVQAGDGGVAFVNHLSANGIAVNRDRGNRLHLNDGYRDIRLDTLVVDRDQERYLAGLLDRNARFPEFTSTSDRQDASAERWRRIEQERAARQTAAAVRTVARQPAQAARHVANRVAVPAKAAATVARGVEGLAGALLNSVTSVMTGFGKYQEQDAEAREAPPPPVSAPTPGAARQAREYLGRQDTPQPDAQTRSVAATQSGAVSHELQEKLRRLAEEERRRERERDDDSGRERRR